MSQIANAKTERDFDNPLGLCGMGRGALANFAVFASLRSVRCMNTPRKMCCKYLRGSRAFDVEAENSARLL